MSSEQSAVNSCQLSVVRLWFILYTFCFLSGCTGSPALYPVNFFRDYISQADGNRCPMHPSCSGYAVEAVKKHGPVMGWVMICDRLMRCGRDEKTRSDRIQLDDGYYCHDPVSNNDFWFDSRLPKF